MPPKKPAISPAEKRRLAEQRRLRVIERKALATEREATSAEIRADPSKVCLTPAETIELQEFEDREARHQRRRERCRHQIDWLNQRSRKPKGYKAMKTATAKTPIGQLWISLCHADGQINYLTRNSDVTIEDRERLLLIHFKLRLKSHSAAALAKVCPVALLSQTESTRAAAFEDQPEDDDHCEHDGLTEQQQADFQDLENENERQRLQALLGL